MSSFRRMLKRRLPAAVAMLLAATAACAFGQDLILPPASPTSGTPAIAPTTAWPPVANPYPVGGGPALTAPTTSPAFAPIHLDNLIAAENPTNSHWYARWDYFTWNERLDGQEFVRETGSLATVGYQRRLGVERFRAELFGGTLNYHGSAMFDDGSSEPLDSYTSYLGMRAEFDLLWEPEGFPNAAFFAGAGTRFWVRDLKDGFTPSGAEVWGYQEIWWTIYPYVGMEVKQPLSPTLHFFGSMRAGITPVTLEQVPSMDVVLYPKCGVTGQLECGLRGQHFTLSAYLEAMDWGQSAQSRDILQPYSRMFIAGVKGGWAF